MTPEQMKDAAKGVFVQMKGYIERAIAPVVDRLAGLEKRIAELSPGEKGEKGEPGKDGAAGAPGPDGATGERGPPGEKGEKGRDGIGIASVEAEDGKSFDIVLDNGHRIEVQLPPGVKGDDGERGQKGEPGEKGADGRDGRDGRDGEPGRDATQIEILPGVDPTKSYPRGTHAIHRGGTIRAFKATAPLAECADLEPAGWQVVQCGVAEVICSTSDDGRMMTRCEVLTDGRRIESKSYTPAMIYRDIWRDDGEYAKGDAVTRDGSIWVLQADVARGKPGDEGSGWRLAVKRGRDGLKGDRGDRGAPGRDGKPE